MTLIEEADRAEKIGTALTAFKDWNPDNVRHINEAISECLKLSVALGDTQDLIDSDIGRGLSNIESDLQSVHEAITFTLQDIWLCLGKMGGGRIMPTGYDYQRAWDQICRHCLAVGGIRLSDRLRGYRRFLKSLCQTLRRQSPDLAEMRDLRQIILEVRVLQNSNKGLITSFESDPPETGLVPMYSPRPQRSYERARDPNRPMSPTESAASSEATRFRDVPFVPSPPLSPGGTFSTISQISSLPSMENESSHWAKQVFKHVSSTQFPSTGEISRYHEGSGLMEQEHPSQAYDPVVILKFPDALTITLFCRMRDYRSKVVVQYRDYRRQSDFACVPLERLQLRRKGSLLRLGWPRPDHRFLVWLTMKFTSIERLILFAGTFIAMRAQDGTRPAPTIQDDESMDEEPEFSGKIKDNGYRHALRIYRDRLTNAIRLQASVRNGELDRTPVWTAFITHYISSRTWCRQVDRKVVYLAELRPHIFSSTYEPELAPNGAFMLQFENHEDAECFVERINILRRMDGRF